ncbi:FAD-dependent monooxygenase [Synechococcus sp. CS-1325]|nr:FAD-dependent monooxygenase [Synechococcus sp. CS-1325]
MPPAPDPLPLQIAPCWDVVVVGAGPAGALAAHGLARRGVRVLLVEQRRFPRWKVCGACLSPQALAALEAAGLAELVAQQGGLALRVLQLGVAGLVSPIVMEAGRVLSRARLDQALLEAAVAAGAEVLTGTRAVLGAAAAGADPDREVVLQTGTDQLRVTARVVLIAAGLSHRCLDSEPEISTSIEPHSRVGAGCVLPGDAAGLLPGVLQMAVGRGGVCRSGACGRRGDQSGLCLRSGLAALQRRCGSCLPQDPGGSGLRATPRFSARPGSSVLAAHRGTEPPHTPTGWPPPAAAGRCRRLRGALHRRRHGLGSELLSGCPAPGAARPGALGWRNRNGMAAPPPALGEAAAGVLPRSGTGVAPPRDQLGTAPAGRERALDHQLHD